MLIRHGADASKSSGNGTTPMHSAAAFGRSKVVEILIRAGADCNKAKYNGATPLFVAAQVRFNVFFSGLHHFLIRQQAGSDDLVSLLLRSGADPTAKSECSTAKDMALLLAHQSVVDIIDAHHRRQLRRRLADLCTAFRSKNLPVLVLLECFAWHSASAAFDSEDNELALDLQWRIAKRIKDCGDVPENEQR